jgi:hypothetical protein
MCINFQSLAIINNKQQINPTTTKVWLFHIFLTHQKGQKSINSAITKVFLLYPLTPTTSSCCLTDTGPLPSIRYMRNKHNVEHQKYNG